MQILIWVSGIAFLILIGYLLDREIYFYEGAHLGPRVQAWLYDRWSRKYDTGKRESQLRDDEMLARPLLELLKETPEPFILDFATGTGRLSYALLNQPDFNGHIIALDLSQGMLEQALAKLSALGRGSQVELLRHLALPLPFPDETFDAVCALEVLELFQSVDEPLAELTRVLRPGGILLTSRGTEESGRALKVKSKSIFTSILENHGYHEVQIVKWWKLFDRVSATRNGDSQPVGAAGLIDVLLCGKCRQTNWERRTGKLICRHCKNELSVTRDGIVQN